MYNVKIIFIIYKLCFGVFFIMEFNYFDIVVGSIILLLGLKGIINGFFKEVFGLVGIIGGLFIASRSGDEVGTYLNSAIFNFQSESAISFTGFITTLAIFWLAMITIGIIFKKLSSISGLTPMDKLLGFVFGSSKFFLIGAVIVNSLHNIKTIKENIEPQLQNSILYPILVETGAYIMKIDPVEVTKKIDKKVDESVNSIQKHIQDGVKNEVSKAIDSAKEQLQTGEH